MPIQKRVNSNDFVIGVFSLNRRRVVITGLGMVTPLGNSVATTWEGILQGRSGIRMIDSFDTTNFSARFAGTVVDFDPSQLLSSKEARKMDMFIQYGIFAAAEAFKYSGLVVTEANASRIGVAIGSGIGGLQEMERGIETLQQQGPRRISPFFIPTVIINMVAGHVSILFGLRGPNIALVSACTTGTHNIGYAARTIMMGDADVMLAGGAEKASTPLGMAGFAAARALSTRNDQPEQASRPWDKHRDGFVLGDGAGVVMLEEYEHAKKRGAKIYAELAGFGLSADANHMTLPPEDGQGAVDSMQHALRDAGMDAAQVNYINAHATSTYAGDRIESLAIERCFGDYPGIAVSSTKSMTGHLLGAAGAIETIFCALAIRDQIAPPTINFEEAGEGCDLDYVPNKAREMKIDVALNNSFGFGGTNGSLILSKIA